MTEHQQVPRAPDQTAQLFLKMNTNFGMYIPGFNPLTPPTSGSLPGDLERLKLKRKRAKRRNIMAWKTASKEESDYFNELEEAEEYSHCFDGSYQASKGDYEGAILAAEEFNSGRIS